MARPLRISYEGAVYHITARGNDKKDIYLSDTDRQFFLTVLSKTISRHKWICHAYCLMHNHYHLLIETPHPNISIGMRQINGIYTQHFNPDFALGVSTETNEAETFSTKKARA